VDSRSGLAALLETCGPDYRATHTLSAEQRKAWRAIVSCRTGALGGHLECCDTCGTSRHVYHSCRNRHCPLCQTRAKEAWLAARRRELLPVPYFHLVFTLPHTLHGLVAAYPRLMYERLFAAASDTLTTFAADPRHLGGEAAFSLILHTWKQDLGRHVHVHALIAGGALADNGQWIPSRRGFLFPVRALSRVFRGKFVAALEACRTAGLVPAVADDNAWQPLHRALHAHDWVVYAKQPLGGPAQVLEYLGRYTHRVAISNERIIGIDQGDVLFRVRADATNRAKRTVRLPAAEFIERFLLHILPTGFKRIRHYGLLAPARKAMCLPLARDALEAPPPDTAVIESLAQFMQRVTRLTWNRCPHCGIGHFVVIAVLVRPGNRAPPSRGPPCST
jgi:Putative transposase/Transposase zinc-binding domain